MAAGASFISKGTCRHVIVDGPSGIITYCPSTCSRKYIQPVGTFQGNDPLSEENPSFEIRIKNSGQYGKCSIGLVQANYQEDQQPGWMKGSIGYHADDGYVYMNGTDVDTGAGPCREGDTMGLKIDKGLNKNCVTFNQLRVSFYKNGCRIYQTSWPCCVALVFPMIGFHSSGEQVELLNFIKQLTPIPLNLDVCEFIGSGKMTRIRRKENNKLAYTCSARQPVGVYMSKYSLTKEQNVFGIRIESVGERGCIALGVAHDAYDMASQPGWRPGSIGYHADDQGLYYDNDGRPMKTLSSACGNGSIMECAFNTDGVNFNEDGTPCVNQTLQIIFSRNGQKVHTCDFKYFGGGLHPTIGMHSLGERVSVVCFPSPKNPRQNSRQGQHAPLKRLSAPKQTGQDDRALAPVQEENASVVSTLDHDNDLFTCSICLEAYDEQTHQPKLLSCHHTFCQQCLEQMLGAGQSKALHCPSCRFVVPVPTTGIPSLQTNFYVNSAMQLLKGAAKLPETSGDFVIEQGCKNHSNQPLSFYCKTCSEFICRDCTVLRHSMSSDHKVVEVCDYKQECVQILKDRKFTIGRALSVSEKKTKDLQSLLSVINVKKEQMQLWLDAKFDGMVETINNARESLKNDLESYHQENCDTVDNKLGISRDEMENLKLEQNRLSELIEQGDVNMIINVTQSKTIDNHVDQILKAVNSSVFSSAHLYDEFAGSKFKEKLQSIQVKLMDDFERK